MADDDYWFWQRYWSYFDGEGNSTVTRRSKGKPVLAEHIDIEQVLSGITHGRHDCPIKDCPEWFWTVGDKKRHIRDAHPKER